MRIVYHLKNYPFNFSSIFLDILKINKIRTAQKDAIIPIKATRLSPSNGFLKSKRKTLRPISAMARKISMLVKIFMCYVYVDKSTKIRGYAKKPLTLAAHILTSINKTLVITTPFIKITFLNFMYLLS